MSDPVAYRLQRLVRALEHERELLEDRPELADVTALVDELLAQLDARLEREEAA